jgi:hypothetical protein
MTALQRQRSHARIVSGAPFLLTKPMHWPIARPFLTQRGFTRGSDASRFMRDKKEARTRFWGIRGFSVAILGESNSA